MKRSKLVFIALFALIALALSVSAVGADESATTQPTVKLWAFYDKDVNAYPTGWWYLDPVITDPSAWQQDSPWLPFPSPHYALYGGTWGSDTMGALIQEGDFGPGVAEIPLADGLYWVVLSAPPGNWHLTTDAVQKVYVWNGNVYVQWANEGLWYGDKVLVGIIDGAPVCPGELAVDLYCFGDGLEVDLEGYGFRPDTDIRTGGNWGSTKSPLLSESELRLIAGWLHDDHQTDSQGYFECGTPDIYDAGTYTVWALDTETNCEVSRTFEVTCGEDPICHFGP